MRVWNDTWNGKQAYWNDYQDDWHNITFDNPFMLLAEKEYYYEIKTGSYPQIHHTGVLLTANGWINCTAFVDVDGKKYDDWIPAIKLE